MGIFSNPAKDAKKIQDKIDYRILKAAWDSYAHINAGSAVKTYKVATPAWFALFATQNYNGDFRKFTIEELHLLKAVTTVNTAYDAIIKGLEDSKQDEGLARQIMVTHPNLAEAIPDEYNNVEKINDYIVSVIRQYQVLLSEFYKKHQKKIDSAIEKLEDEAANQEPVITKDDGHPSDEQPKEMD